MQTADPSGAGGARTGAREVSHRCRRRPLRADGGDDEPESRRTRLQARISRAIEFVGVGIAAVVPLVLLIVAVETRSPVAGGAGLFLGGIAALLIANR